MVSGFTSAGVISVVVCVNSVCISDGACVRYETECGLHGRIARRAID